MSVLISINLYRQLIQPLTYLKQGISAIKDQDFNFKFSPTGKREVDELVDVYNRMIDELRTERSSKMMRIEGMRTYKVQKSRFIDRGFERIFIMLEEVTAELFEAEKNVYSKVIRMMAHEVNNTGGPVNFIIHSALSQCGKY